MTVWTGLTQEFHYNSIRSTYRKVYFSVPTQINKVLEHNQCVLLYVIPLTKNPNLLTIKCSCWKEPNNYLILTSYFIEEETEGLPKSHINVIYLEYIIYSKSQKEKKKGF